MDQGEIVIYKTTDDSSFQMEVIVKDESVWLTQSQMSELFQTTRNNITLHISNIFKENELSEISVSKESLLTANDGKKYKNKLYNLDMIISVGYRVKSVRGVQFRIWANKILKDFLLKGYAVQKRFEKIEIDVAELTSKVNDFDLQINTFLPPNQGIFFDGQVYDAWKFVSDIVKTANANIIVIDNYVDDTVLTLLTKRNSGVKATIYTNKITKEFSLDCDKHNKQYDPIELKTYTKSHDRFLIIDSRTVYHIGASLKDLGRRWFAFSKIEIDANSIIERLR